MRASQHAMSHDERRAAIARAYGQLLLVVIREEQRRAQTPPSSPENDNSTPAPTQENMPR